MTIGLLCLVGIIALCFVGLWHPQYNDNIGHCVGMVLVGLWAMAQAWRVMHTQYVPADDLWLYVGILSFGSGTAVRTYLYRRRKE